MTDRWRNPRETMKKDHLSTPRKRSRSPVCVCGQDLGSHVAVLVDRRDSTAKFKERDSIFAIIDPFSGDELLKEETKSRHVYAKKITRSSKDSLSLLQTIEHDVDDQLKESIESFASLRLTLFLLRQPSEVYMFIHFLTLSVSLRVCARV